MPLSAIWIRNDLRLHDNTAFISAVEECRKNKLLMIFHIDQKQIKEGTNSHDYFFSALDTFYKECLKKQLDIYFLYGETEEAFKKLIKDFPEIKRIYFNYDETGYGMERDDKIIRLLKEAQINVSVYYDSHLHFSDEILTKENKNYKVFTSYYNKWKEEFKKPEQKMNINKLKEIIYKEFENKDLEAKIKYEKIIKNIKRNFNEITGEEKGRKLLHKFSKERLTEYEENKDYPYIKSTSHLSPFLSTGQISIREVFEKINNMPYSKGKENFIKELAWRDFYNMIYHFYPNQKNEEIIPKYRGIYWNYNEEYIGSWKEGMTGFPIVDAGMRQLNKEGWINNRLRMIVASFLVKDLLIDWRIGEEYFSKVLIDYDSSSNIGGWQWVASVGTDPVPYFRIFNPIIQSKKFDPEGRYIRKYVPELKNIPSKFIHEPFKYEKQLENELKRSSYPKPIVDHKNQRSKALYMFDI